MNNKHGIIAIIILKKMYVESNDRLELTQLEREMLASLFIDLDENSTTIH